MASLEWLNPSRDRLLGIIILSAEQKAGTRRGAERGRRLSAYYNSSTFESERQDKRKCLMSNAMGVASGHGCSRSKFLKQWWVAFARPDLDAGPMGPIGRLSRLLMRLREAWRQPLLHHGP